MGASGKMDAEIPPDAGERCLRLKLRPAVRVLAFIQLSASPPWRTGPFCALGPITLVSRDGLTSCPGRWNRKNIYANSQMLIKKRRNLSDNVLYYEFGMTRGHAFWFRTTYLG